MGKGEKGRGGQGVAGWKGKEKLLRQSVAADSSCDGGKPKKKKRSSYPGTVGEEQDGFRGELTRYVLCYYGYNLRWAKERK